MRRIKSIKVLIASAIVLGAAGGIVAHWISKAPQRALEKQIVAMIGMNVELTFKNAEAYYNGMDSTFSNLHTKKLIVFVDSTSCSGCVISHLNDYYEINDSLKSKQAEMIVVLQPKKDKIDEVCSRLSQERFPFWCIVDVEGEFERGNAWIPENQLLHTFETDEHDNIILVGNPTRNQRIIELMLNTL